MSGFSVACETTDAASVRLRVATDDGFTTGVELSSEATPDGDGYATCTITGLDPDTDYYYRIEMEDSGGTWHDDEPASDPIRMLATPGDPDSHTLAFGSCVQPESPNDQAFTNIIARGPDMFFFLGDWGYPDSSSTDQDVRRGDLESIHDAFTDLKVLTANVPTYRLLSDHDGTDGNNGGPGAWTPSIRGAHKQFFPTPALSNSDGLYYSVPRGRVKYIFTDSRFLSTSTSMFGSTQQAWFINELTSSEPVKIWVQDMPWTDNDAGTPGEDKWADKSTNQQDVADLIAANAVGKVITIGGDMHSIAADDGTNDPTGIGLVNWIAAPFHNEVEQEAGPWSEGIYPTSGSALSQQYGWVDVDDDGSTITVTYTGYDSSNTARVTPDPVVVETAVDLDANDAAHAHSATSPTLSQTHVLDVDDASHAHAATEPTVVQGHQLAADNASHAHAATSPAVTQGHVLDADDAAHAHSATEPALTQGHVLAADNADHAHAATEPTVSQGHVLDVDDAAHAHAATEPDLAQSGSLGAANASHAHTATEPTITQHHQLTPDDATHAHTATSPTLGATVTLAPDDCTHGHTVTEPALTQGHVLDANDASHEHDAGSPTLGQTHVLDVDDATHAHAASEPTLLAAGTLGVNPAQHAHTATSPTLTQAHTLVAADALHGHTVTSPTVTAGSILVDPDDATHGHSATSPTIGQHHVLAPANATHSHTATSVDLDGPVIPVGFRTLVSLPVDRELVALSSSRTLPAWEG